VFPLPRSLDANKSLLVLVAKDAKRRTRMAVGCILMMALFESYWILVIGIALPD
jgi:F0F1-type ATP synthase membrane subunit c/vacuolar-type H+-ATPase subunit K